MVRIMIATVSVIIPTYNRGHLVGRAILSVLDQTYQDFEIIVVDDGSKDYTEEVVKSFNDPRICYIRHTRNLGGSAARNTGIRAAKGKYIAFLDSDDEWLPTKLEEQIRVFHNEQNCGVVYTDLLRIYSDGRIELYKGKHLGGWVLKDLLVTSIIGSTSSAVIKRECFDVVGLFDETLPSCQDWDMWIRIAKKYPFKRVPKPLVKYYLHGEQISSNRAAVLEGRLEITRRYYADICACGNKVEANHCFIIGNRLCHIGELHYGRKYLLRAAARAPWNFRFVAYAFVSLFGKKAYSRIAYVKQLLLSKRNKN